jgi:flagellar M-ring protein FliF
MASAVQLADLAQGFNQLQLRNKVGFMVAVAMLVAVGVGSWLWSSAPDYKLLYANVSDRDGGAIIAALAQANVPYKVAEGGNAILVPARQVHDTRLRLASQGLPRGGVVGFELLENQKLGATQFQEQVNYQRALEGELARSIQTLSAVASARVHLAIPKPSVFLREQQKPSASVIVNLHVGRALDRSQVAGIAHLVSSSVADLPINAVSVLDQSGNLLSAQQGAGNGLDGDQLAYVNAIEAATNKRIADILEPIAGRANVRVQVMAELDFSQTESTAETYAPNQMPQSAVVRSERRSESSEPVAPAAQGVPGAASNQPRAASAAANEPVGATASTKKDSTINYEVDKTVRRVRTPVGVVKRLSAAVLVNHRKAAGVNGAFQPLPESDMAQIGALAKEAMGFSQERGDTISIANVPFSVVEPEPVLEVPAWKQPENVALAMDAGKALLALMVILYILRGILGPVLRTMAEAPHQQTALLAEEVGEVPGAGDHVKRLQQARQLAKSDPKVVANVVKTWVATDE